MPFSNPKPQAAPGFRLPTGPEVSPMSQPLHPRVTADPEAFLRELFDVAVAAAVPSVIIPPALGPRPEGRVVVLGAGKASAAMAAAVEDQWGGDLEGLIVTRYGHSVPTKSIEVVEASHPVPDAAGAEAARRILSIAESLGPNDTCLCLISGGGSALTTLPAEGVTLDDKMAVNKLLLSCGATIGEINSVRKHLSAFKGGRLAAAVAPARLISLLISDVPGDGFDVIASGPTVPDESTLSDARAVVEKYELDVPSAVRARLNDPTAETPKADDPVFANASASLVAAPQLSLEAAATLAREVGVTPFILSDRMEGEARDIGLAHAAIAQQIQDRGQPLPMPALILSGGETTVTLRGDGGRGGRNTEFLAGFAQAIGGRPGIWGIACDTDGIDGSEDNAGGVCGPDTLSKAAANGMPVAEALARNDAYGFFKASETLVETGPTLTNVNDFRAVLVLPANASVAGA